MKNKLKRITKTIGIAILVAVAGRNVSAQITTFYPVNGQTYYVCQGVTYTFIVNPDPGYEIYAPASWMWPTTNQECTGSGGCTFEGVYIASIGQNYIGNYGTCILEPVNATTTTVVLVESNSYAEAKNITFYIVPYVTTITGPSTYCLGTNGVVFTASDDMTGNGPYTWQPTSFMSGSSSGNKYTETSSTNGTGNITVINKSGVCPTSSASSNASLSITAGLPASPTITATTIVGDACPNYHYNCTATAAGATSFVWGVSNTTNFSVMPTENLPGYGAASLNIISGYSESTYLTAQAENICGVSATTARVIVVSWSQTKCGGAMKSGIKPGDNVENAFKVYPNPAQSMITIEYSAPTDNSSDVNIDVYDMLGKKVTTWTLPGTTTTANEDVSALPKGMYIYVVNNGSDVLERGKLMVQR